MYQIGIYDDEPVFSELLSRQVAQILTSRGIPCRIHIFQTNRELSAFLSARDCSYPPPV